MNPESSPNNLSAIVLAAGQSRRMAPQNKLLLPFRGKTVIQTVLDAIVPLGFVEILVVTGFEKNRIEEALRDYRVRLVFNADHEQGMATSIAAGISEARTNSDGFMIFLGDMPWIEQEVLRRQIQTFYGSPEESIVVSVFEKRRGNPVIFAQKYRNELLKLRGDRGARSVMERYPEKVIEVPVRDERALNDLDHRKDIPS